MDLSEIKTTERVIEILHPKTDEPVGLRVSLLSINDPAMKAIKRRIQDEKTRLDRSGKILKAERIEENQNELIFGAMTGWEWYDATLNGKKPDFNKASVIHVLSTNEWIVDQLSKEISDEKAFF